MAEMPPTPERFMVMTPHPDDCEIGCGGTAAKWIRRGAVGVLVVCTNGDKGSEDPELTSAMLAAIREKEQTEAAKILGFSKVVFLKYPDGELEDTKKFRGELVREIRTHRPDIVLTVDPFRQNGYMHRDHRMTGQATLDAVFPLSRDRLNFPEHEEAGVKAHKTGWTLLWGTETPDTWMDVSETMDVKIQALGKHVSQMGEPGSGRDFSKFIKEMSAKAGQEHGMAYAESFKVLSYRR